MELWEEQTREQDGQRSGEGPGRTEPLEKEAAAGQGKEGQAEQGNDGQADFDTLIRGEYKEAFERRVQKILDGRLRQLRSENEALRERAAGEEAMQLRQLEQLAAQEETIRQVYPEFAWEQEMKDPGFARLIRGGVDGRTAYEVVHRQELLRRAVSYGASAAREQMARTIISGGQRVRENGGQRMSILHTDPKGLTSAELTNIRQRVQRGEKISF